MTAPSPPDGGAVPPERLRVLTLNLWGRRGAWAKRRDVLDRGLRALQPDLIAFQESIVTDGDDQVAELLWSEYHLTHHSRRDPDGQGISIATRWRPQIVHHVDLQVSPRTADFSCTALVTELAVPKPFGTVVFGNHCPNWQSDHELEREQQAVIAAGHIEQQVADRDVHVVVAGDLTSTPDSANVRFWRGRQSLGGTSVCYDDAWQRTHPDQPGHTFSPRNPLRSDRWLLDQGRRIDYLFVRCGSTGPTLDVAACSLAFDEPEDGVWVSDHFGIVADLVVPGAGP